LTGVFFFAIGWPPLIFANYAPLSETPPRRPVAALYPSIVIALTDLVGRSLIGAEGPRLTAEADQQRWTKCDSTEFTGRPDARPSQGCLRGFWLLPC